MDSNPEAGGEDHGNTETEEGSVAFHKKRSRRVSFAENTSVHIFDRDEEYETPPDPKPSEEQRGLGFQQDISDSKDEEEDDEEDDTREMDSATPFLRPLESPSSGSILSSATSNDDFFGPVSASLIRPGQLSDSDSSDENHDVTKDSTFFSMHFRSLDRSDSGGDLKTSTGVHLSFEEKTPTQDPTSTSVGNSMVLTAAKKPNSRSTMPSAKLSGGNDSNDMSLVRGNLGTYDFGRLSPELDALLAEGSKDLLAVSISDNIIVSTSPRNMEGIPSSQEQGGSLRDLYDDVDKETDETNTHDILTEVMPVAKIEETVKDSFETSRHGVGLSAVDVGTLSNLDNIVPQLEGFTQQEYRSPLAGFISSSKQSRILLDTATPSISPWVLSHSPKQIDSLARNGNIIHSKSTSSIQKSISKLAVLEASPFFSTPNAEIGNSNLRSVDHLFKTLPFETVAERKSKGPCINDVDGSGIETSLDVCSKEQLSSAALKKREQSRLINMDDNRIEVPQDILDGSGIETTPLDTCSKEQLFSVPQKKGEHRTLINMYDNRIEIPKDNGDVGYSEESTSLAEGGRSPYHVSAGTLGMYQPIKVAAAVALPSFSTWSREKMQPNLLISEDHTDGTLVTSGTNFFLTEITPRKIVSSLEKSLGMELITSPEYQGSLSREPRTQLQYKKLVSPSPSPGQRAASRRNVINATNSNDRLDSKLVEKTGSPNEFSKLKGITEEELINERKINLHGLQDKSGTMGNVSTPVGDRDSQNVQSTILDRNFQTGRDLAWFENDLPMGGIHVASCGSTSPFAHRNADEPSLQKNLLESFVKSPSRRNLCNTTHGGNNLSSVEDLGSPKSYRKTNGLQNSSARKRRSEEIILPDRDHMDELATTQRSPKLHKGGLCDPEFLERQNESNSGPSTSGHKFKHWADIYSKFSGDTKQLLSSSIDKLNLCTIDVLEDILVHLWRSKKYEMLCTEIQSQKTSDPQNNVYHKRVVETRLLLLRIMHEQLKLQLMRVKRDRLMEKVQVLSSGIQESQMLKLNHLPRLSRDVKVDDDRLESSGDVQEVACDIMTAMGQSLEASDERIMNLTNFFYNSCKMKRESGSADIIVLVNDHLVKRTRCRFIRLDSQLWVIDNLESRNGHHNVVLNYLSFISQRLKVNVGQASSISITNKLNDMNIAMNLPDMHACTAFSFILDAETTRKYVGPRSLAQETQISSSLLGNLLDVVEEVQQARIELRNLSDIKFNSPIAEHLDLQLCFFDFMSGRKAILTLDMTCLKWGVYPSEIVPSELAVDQTLFAEIRAAVQNLRFGYFRIIRLCRCISQVVQSSSK